MTEKKPDFNVNPDIDPIEILRLSIIDKCGLFPDVCEKYLELRTIGREEGIRIKQRLELLPGVKAAMRIARDPDHENDWVFSINIKKYKEYYRENRLLNGISSRDTNDWERLKDLERVTSRSWGEAHSNTYKDDVVRMISFGDEPASRNEQVAEMSHQLLGDSRSAKAETHDWIRHMENSEAHQSPPLQTQATALPSTWVTKANVADMASRLFHKEVERERLQRVLLGDPKIS